MYLYTSATFPQSRQLALRRGPAKMEHVRVVQPTGLDHGY